MASTAVDVEFGSSPPNDCHDPLRATLVREEHETGAQVRVGHRHLRGDQRLDRDRRRVDVEVGPGRVADEVPAAVRLLRGADERDGVGAHDATDQTLRDRRVGGRVERPVGTVGLQPGVERCSARLAAPSPSGSNAVFDRPSGSATSTMTLAARPASISKPRSPSTRSSIACNGVCPFFDCGEHGVPRLRLVPRRTAAARSRRSRGSRPASRSPATPRPRSRRRAVACRAARSSPTEQSTSTARR